MPHNFLTIFSLSRIIEVHYPNEFAIKERIFAFEKGSLDAKTLDDSKCIG